MNSKVRPKASDFIMSGKFYEDLFRNISKVKKIDNLTTFSAVASSLNKISTFYYFPEIFFIFKFLKQFFCKLHIVTKFNLNIFYFSLNN